MEYNYLAMRAFKGLRQNQVFSIFLLVIVAFSAHFIATDIVKAVNTAPAGWNVKPFTKLSIVKKGQTQQKIVALTFDDGPDPRFTPKILDILKRNHIKATFFVVGKNARRYPRLLNREIMEGNVVGNHTWDHPHLRRISTAKIKKELDKTSREITRITGQRPKYMRPPYGQLSNRVYSAIYSRKYKVILWSDEFQEHIFPTPQLDSEYVSRNIEPGGIILGHDGRLDRRRCVKALPLVIAKLKAKGYRFVTIEELINKRDH